MYRYTATTPTSHRSKQYPPRPQWEGGMCVYEAWAGDSRHLTESSVKANTTSFLLFQATLQWNCSIYLNFLNFPTERKALKKAFKLQWTQLRPFAQQQIGDARHARSEGWQQTHHRWPPESVTVSNLVSVYFMTLWHYLQCAIRVTTIVPNFLQCFGESTNCKSQPVSNPNQLCGRSPSLCAFAHLNGHAIWWDTDPNGLGAASWVLTWKSEKSWRDCAPGPIHLRSWHCYLDQQSKVQHPLGQDSP